MKHVPLPRAGQLLPVLLASLAFVTACKPAQPWNGQLVDPLEGAPALQGTNWNGEPFDLAELRDKVVVVFFGYTFCPDVCPMTLAKMKMLQTALGEAADDLAVVFVSVDPHRDSVEKLASYVPNFDPSFYGVRLEFHELDEVQEAWDLTVQLGQPKDGPGTDSFYYVDHTGFYFVVDRQGQLRLTYPPNVDVGSMQGDIERLLAG